MLVMEMVNVCVCLFISSCQMVWEEGRRMEEGLWPLKDSVMAEARCSGKQQQSLHTDMGGGRSSLSLPSCPPTHLRLRLINSPLSPMLLPPSQVVPVKLLGWLPGSGMLTCRLPSDVQNLPSDCRVSPCLKCHCILFHHSDQLGPKSAAPRW